MNVIIIAACIPTFRPIFLVLFRRPGADNFRASVRERGRSSYHYRTSISDGSKKTTTKSNADSEVFDKRVLRARTGSTEAIIDSKSADGGGVIQVESREVGSRDEETEEGEWGHTHGSGVPMTNLGNERDTQEGEAGRLTEDALV